jgi:hypothetical protein
MQHVYFNNSANPDKFHQLSQKQGLLIADALLLSSSAKPESFSK